MTFATISDVVAPDSSPHAPGRWAPLGRTIWKEYRTLRGFWLGVAALAIVAMGAAELLARADLHGGLHLVIAMMGAILFAAGAAATMFAGEQDAGAELLLQLLPRRRTHVALGKAVAIILGGALLALVLAVVGLALARRAPPSAFVDDFWRVTPLGILEATAWGLLASLLIRQPLVAAVAAVASWSIATPLCRLTAESSLLAPLGLSSTPRMLLVRVGVLAALTGLDSWLALRWLNPCKEPAIASRPRRRAPLLRQVQRRLARSAPLRSRLESVGGALAHFASVQRSMFGRLQWQAVRESWRPLLATLGVGLFLMVAGEAALSLLRGDYLTGVPRAVRLPPLPTTLLAIPALLGAMTFRADHRPGAREFLAHRAAPPALLWLSRTIAWLGPVLLLAAAIHAVAWWLLGRHVAERATDLLYYDQHGYYWLELPGAHFATSTKDAAVQILRAMQVTWSTTLLAWAAVVTAYAVGQFCSLTIASPVLSGFVAMTLSVVLLAWTYVLWAWELSGAWFLAPLALAAFGATLVRLKPWLIEVGGLRGWGPAAALLAAAVALVAWRLPRARLEQLTRYERQLAPRPATAERPSAPQGAALGGLAPPAPQVPASTVDALLKTWESENHQAKAVADRYEKLAASINPASEELRGWQARSPVVKRLRELRDERLRAAEETPAQYPADADGAPRGGYGVVDPAGAMGAYGGEVGGIYDESEFYLWLDVDEEQMTPEELTLRKEAAAEHRAIQLEANQGLYEQVAENSRAPACALAPPPTRGQIAPAASGFQSLVGELLEDARRHMDAGRLDAALDRLLTLSRMAAHWQQRLPSHAEPLETYLANWPDLPQPDALWRQWASAPDQTAARLKTAIDGLLAAELRQQGPAAQIVADYQTMTEVLAGERTAVFTIQGAELPGGGKALGWQSALTLVAHQFSWERRRAEVALRLLANYRLELAAAALSAPPPGWRAFADPVAQRAELRSTLRTGGWAGGEQLPAELIPWPQAVARSEMLAACRTSYFNAKELPHQWAPTHLLLDRWLNEQVRRRGRIVMLALLAYRLDHGELPPTLVALSPDYVASPALIDDPYTATTFEYRREGFDLPLELEAVNPSTDFLQISSQAVPARTPLIWSVGKYESEPVEFDYFLAPLPSGKRAYARKDEPGAEPRRAMFFQPPLRGASYQDAPVVVAIPALSPRAQTPPEPLTDD